MSFVNHPWDLFFSDVRREGFENYYALAFLMSIIWLSFYSYMMVWMITIVGFTLSVPDTVMGLTFVAAGVSSPDVLLGVAAVKEGEFLLCQIVIFVDYSACQINLYNGLYCISQALRFWVLLG